MEPTPAPDTLTILQNLPHPQRPLWPDPAELGDTTARLAGRPPLVMAWECDQLTQQLAAVARGRAFLLQGGDCAETFATLSADAIRGKLDVLLQMALTLAFTTSVPVVTVGRIAGQYAKPRSSPTETRNGTTLPSYRGDAVNGSDFTPQARTPDPARLLHMYEASASTLNLLRGFTAGGYADPERTHRQISSLIQQSPADERYAQLLAQMSHALRFMHACGTDVSKLSSTEVYTSHECLLLEYETALTRIDADTGHPYGTSGHFLWAGERTRDPDGAHIAYLSGIRNPVAVKLGPSASPDDLLALNDRLNPGREPGRLTFITRLGARHIRDKLPDLVARVTAEGAPVVWVCDPMHANTVTSPSGLKTRPFDDVLDEVRGFFEVHHALGTHPGGLHLELTGDDVTECTGGLHRISHDMLTQRYESACDPRLNHSQALELALSTADIVKHPRSPRPETPLHTPPPSRLSRPGTRDSEDPHAFPHSGRRRPQPSQQPHPAPVRAPAPQLP